ncbi:hypothetical protein PVAG01_10506 [Phlyctema vagabunda]|uniref:Uncharacterized protein n=1 Tax=Phlyctema vagabunda TaxID=108571 RepID=A0ABR4P2H2_9HELO
MDAKRFLFAVGTLLSVGSANIFPRVLEDPVREYLSEVCYPNLNNQTRRAELHLSANDLLPSLGSSPFPCEQMLYLNTICTANGTTEIDFLAEQQCLCNGAFFDVMAGCDACFFSHGSQASTPEEASSTVSSLSSAECSPSPPFQPYSNLLPPVSRINITELSFRPSLTLGNDQFPSNTVVSNYFTPTRSIAPGEITGSATARLSSWTNFDGIRFTPTTTPSTSSAANTASSTDTAVSASGGSTTASAPSTIESGNGAALYVPFEGGILAIMVGLAALF